MLYYFVFLTGIFFFFLRDDEKKAFNIFFIIIIFMAFFRYGVGADYFSYKYLYSRLSPNLLCEIKEGIDKDYEMLFRIFGSTLKGMGLSYQHYLVVIALINLFYVYKIIVRYSEKPIISLILYYSFYYFVWTYSGLRQGVAISVGMYYLLKCLEEEESIKFLIITIVLSLVHLSSIVLIPLYYINKIDIKKKHIYWILGLSIFFSLIPIGNIMLLYIKYPIIKRLSFYIKSTNSVISIFDFQSIARLIFASIGLIYYDSYTEKDDISKKIMNTYLIGLSFYFVLKFSELTAARISIYGKYLSIIILANIIYLHKERLIRILYTTLLVILSFIYLNKELNTMVRQAGIKRHNKFEIPYTSIFKRDELEFKNRFFNIMKENP